MRNIDSKSLSTMAAVIPYAFCALATGLVAAHVAGGGPVPRLGPIEVIAFIFSVFTLYGCEAKPVLYGTIMLVLGILAEAPRIIRSHAILGGLHHPYVRV